MKRLFRFRLSTLMAAMLGVAGLCAYITMHAAEFQRESRLIDQLLDSLDGPTSVELSKATDGRKLFTTNLLGFF